MVTLSGLLQSPVQALMRPSMWLPCVGSFHSHKEIWRTETNPRDFSVAVVEAVKTVMEHENNTEYLDIHKVSEDGEFIRIFAFTKAEWLDVVELTYKDGCYEALCCAPFLDMDFNKMRLQRIREALKVEVDLEEM